MTDAAAVARLISPVTLAGSRSTASPPPVLHTPTTPSAPSFISASPVPSLFSSRASTSQSMQSPPPTMFLFQSTIRTISPAIANFRPSGRDIVKAIAPHVLDERRTRRRPPSRSGYTSQKSYHHRHHQRFNQHQSHSPNPWAGPGLGYHSRREKRVPKSSPLRIAASWDENGTAYLQTSPPNPETTAAPDNKAREIKTTTNPPTPSATTAQTRGWSRVSSSGGNMKANTSAPAPEGGDGPLIATQTHKRRRSLRLESSGLLKRIAVKLKPTIKSRLVRSQ